MGLETVHTGFMAIVGLFGLLAMVFHRRVARALGTFFGEAQSPWNLGLLRVLVFWTLFRGALASEASWYASLPADRLKIIPGWEPLAELLPRALPYTGLAEKLFVVASALALFGIFTRVSCAVASLLAIYVLGFPSFYFKIQHGFNVPVLTGLLLAVAPSGDACSVDALIRRLRGVPTPLPSVAYSLPVRFAWLLVGTSYLFPGLAKLWQSGDLWVDGTRLHVSLYEKWAQLPDYEPHFRIDHWPWALALFGIGTLVLEIGFLPALFFRTTRILFGFGASLFHLGVGLTMDIWFDALYPLIVLIDFPQILQSPLVRPFLGPFARFSGVMRERRAAAAAALEDLAARLRLPAGRPIRRRHWVPGLVVGAALFSSMVWAGHTSFNSWPVSIYPKFSGRNARPQRKSFAYTFSAKRRDGTERPLNADFYPIEDSSSIYTLLKTAERRSKKGDEEGANDQLDFVTSIVLGNNPPLERGETVVLRRYEFPVDPERRAGKKRRLQLVAELDPPPRPFVRR
jgi:hypothetical protein